QFPSAVVGFHSFGDANQRNPVLWEKVGRTVLPNLSGRAGASGEARGVNNAKVIVGWSTDDASTKLACQWSLNVAWEVQSLGTLGGPTSEANRISEKGTVVGRADIAANVEHAFRWIPGGPMQDLHFGPGTSTALGVNIHDEVVGEIDPGAGVSQAFRWTAA